MMKILPRVVSSRLVSLPTSGLPLGFSTLWPCRFVVSQLAVFSACRPSSLSSWPLSDRGLFLGPLVASQLVTSPLQHEASFSCGLSRDLLIASFNMCSSSCGLKRLSPFVITIASQSIEPKKKSSIDQYPSAQHKEIASSHHNSQTLAHRSFFSNHARTQIFSHFL